MKDLVKIAEALESAAKALRETQHEVQFSWMGGHETDVPKTKKVPIVSYEEVDAAFEVHLIATRELRLSTNHLWEKTFIRGLLEEAYASASPKFTATRTYHRQMNEMSFKEARRVATDMLDAADRAREAQALKAEDTEPAAYGRLISTEMVAATDAFLDDYLTSAKFDPNIRTRTKRRLRRAFEAVDKLRGGE